MKPGIYQATSPQFKSMIKGLQKKGDAFLKRSEFHSDYGRMWEQFWKEKGYMVGAQDLTWSYASYLTAMHERERLIAAN